MGRMLEFDEIGYWSEVKLDIIKKYATAYSTIMSAQRSIRAHLYIDGFAGAGEHISKATKEFVQGSPLNALHVLPPFTEYHFVDLNRNKADHLRALCGDRPSVHVYEGNCNEVLLRDVFPRAQWSQYRRALCVLDPYGLSGDRLTPPLTNSTLGQYTCREASVWSLRARSSAASWKRSAARALR
jgi:three-Cys-motif partner protein